MRSPRRARPRCSSPTIRRRRCRWDARSPSCATGCLAQRAAPAALYRSPVDADVARFVGEAILAPGDAHGDRVRCALGQLDVANPGLQGQVEVMIRPEQIELVRGVAAAARGATAAVLDHVYYGPDTVLRLSLDGAEQMIVKARTFDHQIPRAGEQVELVVPGRWSCSPRARRRRPPSGHARGRPRAQAERGVSGRGRARRAERRDAAARAAGARIRCGALAVLLCLALGVLLAGCGASSSRSILLYNGQHPQVTARTRLGV